MPDELEEVRQLHEIQELQARMQAIQGMQEAAIADGQAALQVTKRTMAELNESAAVIQREIRKRRRGRGGAVVLPIVAGCAGVVELAKAQPAAAAVVVAVGTVAAAVGLGMIEQPGISHRTPPVSGQRPAVMSPRPVPPQLGDLPVRPLKRIQPVAFKEPVAAPSRRSRTHVTVVGATVRVRPHVPAAGAPKLPRPTLPAVEQPVDAPDVARVCVADVRLVTRVRLLCPDE